MMLNYYTHDTFDFVKIEMECPVQPEEAVAESALEGEVGVEDVNQTAEDGGSENEIGQTTEGTESGIRYIKEY